MPRSLLKPALSAPVLRPGRRPARRDASALPRRLTRNSFPPSSGSLTWNLQAGPLRISTCLYKSQRDTSFETQHQPSDSSSLKFSYKCSSVCRGSFSAAFGSYLEPQPAHFATGLRTRLRFVILYRGSLFLGLLHLNQVFPFSRSTATPLGSGLTHLPRAWSSESLWYCGQ